MRVFVYGTLRHGESNHSLLRQATLLGLHTLPGGYCLYDLGPYPAAVQAAGGAQLVGEVYEIDRTILRDLDELEEYPEVYDRATVTTPYGDAFVYLYQQTVVGLPLIVGGDWCGRIVRQAV